MAVGAGERHATREELEAENARLRLLLAQAGIDARRESHRQAARDVARATDLSESRAETAAAREAASRAEAEIAEAASELARADARVGALRGIQARMHTILETVPVGILVAEAPSGRITLGNGRTEEILGHPPIHAADVAGYAAYTAFHADGRTVAPDEWPLARLVNGEGDRAELEVQYERPDGQRTWISVRGEAVKAVDGTTDGAIVAFQRIDDRKAAEAAQDILNRELSHRLKNTLALVQSIAAQTLRNAESLEAAHEALAARLIVLGKAHDILLSGPSDTACVGAVVQGALALHEDTAARFTLSGPEIVIGPSAALALGLMLHELATNATKYGALSEPGGSVAVTWQVTGAGEAAAFRLDWTERDGPPVTPPSRKGFGSRLIERGFPGGQVRTTYARTGLACRLSVPLSDFGSKEPGHPAPRAPARPVE